VKYSVICQIGLK